MSDLSEKYQEIQILQNKHIFNLHKKVKEIARITNTKTSNMLLDYKREYYKRDLKEIVYLEIIYKGTVSKPKRRDHSHKNIKRRHNIVQ